MLEKLGLPAKPSLRGNAWVVDASHCQGCSSQFSFINRKHHCRRCGGIFCSSCTQQRMVLRGQGDSPVRICDPCKKLEEAARFEMRHGHKSKGSSRLTPNYEDELLSQILRTDGKQLVHGQDSTMSAVSNLQRGASSASSSDPHTENLDRGGEGDILRSSPLGMANGTPNETGSPSPDELRQQALEEKKKYRVLKGEGKPEEALKAFKRGKELERQAGALELALRKSRRNTVTSSSLAGAKKKNDDAESTAKRTKPFHQISEERKDDLAAELKELGWSDADLHDADKKPAKMTLEGELTNLLGEIQQKTSSGKRTGGIDKTQVLAHKKKALTLKREGKLSEAKEELKKAKILEKELEEQEFLADADDSDDELSSLIRSMDDDNSDDLLMQYEKDSSLHSAPFINISDDFALDGNIEVMDEDMNDPEMALALRSLGWNEDSDHTENTTPQVVPVDREALSNEILAIKREALNQKRAGNVTGAMEQLKKAKLLERDLESISVPPNHVTQGTSTSQVSENSLKSTKVVDTSGGSVEGVAPKLPKKTKLMIQRELLALKKKALALRREGRVDEAEEELKKGKVLEQQLDEMENASKVRVLNVNDSSKHSGLGDGDPDVSKTLASGEEGDEGEVTEQDMHDPALLSLLQNLGWKEDDVEPVKVAARPKQINNLDNVPSIIEAPEIPVVAPRRSKAQMQRELLGLKRKALALRRQGNTEEAEEVLEMAKELEVQMEEMDAPKKEASFARPTEPPNCFGSSIAQTNHGSTEAVSDLRKGASPEAPSSAISRNEAAGPLIDLGWKESGTAKPPSKSSTNLMSDMFQPLEGQKIPLMESASPLVGTGITEHAGYSDPNVNLMDMPASGDQQGSQTMFGVQESNFNLENNNISLAEPDSFMGFAKTANTEMGQEKTATIKKIPAQETTTTSGSDFSNDQISLRQEILVRKRKAVALKREGKLVEARDELRQAKLLEKNLIDDEAQLGARPTPSNDSAPMAVDSSVSQEERRTSPVPKPMSSRDRFKLQQESLGHKRQALKLRREGRIQEAEAESELAKALEAQLEELTAHDSVNTSKSEAMDDVGIEDFLDPQLLSALKAIGLQDSQPVSKSPEKPETAKPNVVKGDNSTTERSQLEERIKAEKFKALNFKRAGKQAEALDALRLAKQFEKKLSSLNS